MIESDILSQGITLLVYGMGVVFVFLTLLVMTTRAMSAVVTKYSPAVVQEPTPVLAAVNPRHVAAITAALHQHRSTTACSGE